MTELEKNRESLDDVETGLQPKERGFMLLHPQLLDRAWAANAPRLSQVVADYELVSDLATFYGRIEEPRWRIRYRGEHRTIAVEGLARGVSASERRGEMP